jgi:hypothetical protein
MEWFSTGVEMLRQFLRLDLLVTPAAQCADQAFSYRKANTDRNIIC